jgi:carotenoid 1,2-hydratase
MRTRNFWTSSAMWSQHRLGQRNMPTDNTLSIQSALSGNGGLSLRPGQSQLDGNLSARFSTKPDSGPLFSRGQRTSGTRSADGSPIGSYGGRNPDGSPRFDQAVGENAYLWWYIDALSDDGKHGIVLIAFVGSVFSPYYAWARRNNTAVNPENHCSLNVAIYSKGKNRWAMTERGEKQVERNATEFVIGPSNLKWDGNMLTIQIQERAVPFGQKITGTVELYPNTLFNFSTALDSAGQHRWGPLSPSARVKVSLSSPDLRWEGNAYLDSNEGDEPIANCFHEWDWSRADISGGRTAVIYDVREKNAQENVLALTFNPNGTIDHFEPPQRQKLPKTLWGIQGHMRNQNTEGLKVVQMLENTPFYTRSVLNSELLGEKVMSFHETLSVPKLTLASTQLMLPWRMPRITW